MTEDQVVGLGGRFFNQRCLALVTKNTVRYRNVGVRTTFILKGLKELVPSIELSEIGFGQTVRKME